MAEEDWQRIRGYDNTIKFKNKKSMAEVIIYPSPGMNTLTISKKPPRPQTFKHFGDLRKALAFAKAYMRKH